MNSYVSMLRGINVGGKRRVKMDDLKEFYASMGCLNVQTYVQSGNVIFQHRDSNGSKLAGKIEHSLNEHFGLDIAVLIRTKEELKKLIEKNPFADKDESKLHVIFLSSKPQKISTNQIDRYVAAEEAYSISDKEVYLFCPNGYGRTKLSNNFFEKTMKVTATTRNWRSVNTLYSMSSSL